MSRSALYVVLLIKLLALSACKDRHDLTLFKPLSSNETGVTFNNVIREDNRLNIITFEYLYNGAGVGILDVNNDNLKDIFFSANMTENRLYLNKGDFRFEDITTKSGLQQRSKWATGVSIVDINQDGWQDIYVCYAGPYSDAAMRANELYINNRDNTFTERAAQYGLADTGHSVQAAFFDYDRDGDLDVYVLTNITDETGPNVIRPKRLKGEMANTDRLYRNNGDNTFTNVSVAAGILAEGYGLGISICDINDDGWPDIYVTNDYLSNDLLYINQQDGTFVDQAASYFDHTSYSAMGNDVADYNNDGLIDLVAVDMLPPDNKRQKLMFGATNYDRFQSEIRMGYAPQYMRNTLQLNRGKADHRAHFSEIGQYAGISATDWSWSPLLVDVDNDGLRDLLITNGYPRDITNRDFASYKADELIREGFSQGLSNNLMEEVNKLEGAYLPNFAFRNNGDLTFADSSAAWGFTSPSYSTGAAVADLDNDGDLDYVTNNSNGPAAILRNRARELGKYHYLRIALEGPAGNKNAYGTKLRISTDHQTMYTEFQVIRGYQSSMENVVHFGLGADTIIHVLEITWPNQEKKFIRNVRADQQLTVRYDSKEGDSAYLADPNTAPKRDVSLEALLYRPATSLMSFNHHEAPYADFKIQPLIPHQYSIQGPALAVADVNADGLEDFFLGGPFNQAGQLFVQGANGSWVPGALTREKKIEEDIGALFFDADNDGDQDLYVVSGGSEFAAGSSYYQDRLYANNGFGRFTLLANALPRETASGSCVVGADFDRDGDIDLFVGGRLAPQSYPDAGMSFILRNDGGRFTNVTDQLAPGLQSIGMVTAALWTDFDNDGDHDLIVAGEWMPITLLENERGQFRDITTQHGLNDSRGWWNSISGADIDLDGDIDYVVGNLGLNSRYKASKTLPLHAYASDFNDDGKREAIVTQNLLNVEYPAHPRDDLFSRLPSYKKFYGSYASYASETALAFLKRNSSAKVDTLTATVFATSVLMNEGKGGWILKALPAEAQFAPVYGSLAKDFNGDGNDDLAVIGNSSAPDVLTGKYDALKGLLLVGDGKGEFKSLTAEQSGLAISGDARSVVSISGKKHQLIVMGMNGDSLQQRVIKSNRRQFLPDPKDTYCIMSLKDGRTRRVEFYRGQGYLSQSSRRLDLPDNLTFMTVFDATGKGRKITP